MTAEQSSLSQQVATAEAWFTGHGLPYFVDQVRDEVRSRSRRGRVLLVVISAFLAAAAVDLVVLFALDRVTTTSQRLDGPVGIIVGSVVFLSVLAVYALSRLHAGVIVGWAARRTFGSLGLLFPLVTRALPLLLLFVTFFFINTEVWQVASLLDGGVMWLTVLLFAGVAVGFLAVRLPEELDVFDEQLDESQIRTGCQGTPLAVLADQCAAAELDLDSDHIDGLQKLNLVLVLLIAQVIQVLLLAFSVFVFFVIFGAVAIDPAVIRSWLDGVDTLHPLVTERVSQQLVQVSVFLAAFSGLYFTVYAVSDGNYRQQFFTAILDELQQAVSARAAYRATRRRMDTTAQ